MEMPRPFTLRDLLTHIVGDIAKAVSARPGETPQDRVRRIQAASHMVMSFQPRDAVEAMIACHCVIFHELIVDTVQHTLSGEDGAASRLTRSSILAMDKAFGNNLTRLQRYRARQTEASDAAQLGQQFGETDIADRVRRHQGGAPTDQPPAGDRSPIAERGSDAATIAAHTAPDAIQPGGPLGAAASGADDRIAAPGADDCVGAVRRPGFDGVRRENQPHPQRSAGGGNRRARRHAARHGTASHTAASAADQGPAFTGAADRAGADRRSRSVAA